MMNGAPSSPFVIKTIRPPPPPYFFQGKNTKLTVLISFTNEACSSVMLIDRRKRS